jgi:protein-S-isoprenylcysteine O-methyltransferase Ste14
VFWRVVKTLIFTGIASLSVGILLPAWIGWRHGTASPANWPLRLALQYFLYGFGAALYLWCAWDFVSRGEGTPAPIDAPRHLVISGPYRLVRNPMYVAVCSLIAAQLVRGYSKWILLYLLSVSLLVHLFVVLYEEPHLRKVFDGAYEEYCQRVHRWIPRFRLNHAI